MIPWQTISLDLSPIMNSVGVNRVLLFVNGKFIMFPLLSQVLIQ